jgi:outer membrane protein TolC
MVEMILKHSFFSLSLAVYVCASVCAQVASAPANGPITLDEAIRRAQNADTNYAAAVTDAGVAAAQRGIARSTLLPGVVYHNQYLYTQGQPSNFSTPTSSGTNSPAVRFIANNTIHEYMSQATVTETLGGAGIADYRRSKADAAAAQARLEIARRGLVATVVANYYGLLDADAKLLIAQRALDEAQHFRTNTGQRENGGEVAHADVVKSDLQQQQRQRDLNDAKLAADKARLELGVLLFPDPTAPYTLAATLDTLPPLPARADVDAAAKAHNPDVRAAMEALNSAKLEVTGAKFAYAPDLALNYTYGIDAPQFAIRAPDGTRNLGYSAYATLDIPVWDWFATNNRVKQSKLRRRQSEVELTVAQRRLIVSLNELYNEASVSQQQLTLLDQSVKTAEESLRLTNLRYTAGEGTVLEVVDAQNALVSAQTAHADGAVTYYSALANLQTLTGTLP